MTALAQDEVCAILLVPEDGDPHDLLCQGPFGAMLPVAIRYQCFEGRHTQWSHKPPDTPCACEETRNPDMFDHPMSGTNRISFIAWDDESAAGLVLAWDEQPNARAYNHAVMCGKPSGWNGLSWGEVPISVWIRHCRGLERHGLGTLILLDAQGHEIVDNQP